MDLRVSDDHYIADDISYAKLRDRVEKCSLIQRVFLDIVLVFWSLFLFISFFGYPFILAFVILYFKYGYLILLYYIWVFYDRDTPHNGGRKRNMPTRSRKYLRDYFPVGLIRTVGLPSTKNYIFCTYPHAMLFMGGSINFVHDIGPFKKLYPNLNLYSTTLSSNFFTPIVRDLTLMQGVVAVSERGIASVLKNNPNSGTAINIIVGGAAEVYVTDPSEYRIIIKRRKGFIRIALKTGTSLVPTFSFGENQLYSQVKSKWLCKLQDKFYKMTGYAFVVVKGRRIFKIDTILPRVVPIITVVGEPLDVPKVENPSREQIEEYHQKFCDALYDLFEKYKKQCDPLGNDARLIFM